MLISPFTPLFFIDHKTDGHKSRYIQTFADTDHIQLQILAKTDEEVSAWVLSEPSHETLFQIKFSQWAINDTTTIHFATLCLTKGCYSVRVENSVSEPFMVTDDRSVLDDTTLIRYSMDTNRNRTDCAFMIDGMQHFFEFRVPGGFKDENWSFGVDSEQFMDDYADIATLYGLEFTQKKFTLGNSSGCPVWFAELLNRILCCTQVYFDDVRYCRKDTAVPELTVQIEGTNSFVFTQTLQQVHFNKARYDGRHYLSGRSIESSDFIRSVITESDLHRIL